MDHLKVAIASSVLAASALTGTVVAGSAGVIDGAPDAIVCTIDSRGAQPGGRLVFYIDSRWQDGTLYYKTLGRDSQQLTVNPNGTIEAGNIAACNGRTLEALRANGDTIERR
ncbi:MAG: hypothetical protein AAGF59_12670 [Pseudomonadota bacterium]